MISIEEITMNAELLDAYVLNILEKSRVNEACYDY